MMGAALIKATVAPIIVRAAYVLSSKGVITRVQYPHIKRCEPLGMEDAEEVGFEPTEPCGSPVFKTGAINRSTTPPWYWKQELLSPFSGCALLSEIWSDSRYRLD